MKKLLTILILLLTVASQGWATNIQLWPETEYLLSDTEYCINSIFGNVTNGSTLRISYETTGDTPTLQAFHKNSSWTSADFYNGNLTGSPLEISISTDEQVSNLKVRGLYLKGKNAKITKIELNDTQIWPEVSHQLTNWEEWNIKTKNFSSVVQNKKILISYSTEGSDDRLLEIYYKNDNWKQKNFDDTDFADGTNYYTLTGNSEILTLSSSAATYLQKNGLYFRSRSGSIAITKIEILNNVFDDNGSADLSNLVAEAGNTITSSGGNYTITSNSASSGATLTHAEGETITGKSRLVATFSAEQEVTVIANYTGTNGFSSITKGSDNGGSGDFVVVVPLDNSKTLDNVVIKKVTAGDIVLKSLVVDTQTDGLPSGNIIGNDGKVDLARFAVQDKDSRYNIGTFTLTPKEGYTGIQVWPESENITGKKELNVKFAEAAAAKIEVGYVSEGSSSVIMSEAAKEVKLMLDNTKTIQRVVIQPTTATTITLSEVALNTERTAYENEKELLNPSEKPTISHDTNAQTIDYWKFGNAAEGDKIIVYISSVTTETSGEYSGKAKLTMSAAAQRPSLGSIWGGYAYKEFTDNSTDLQEIIYKLTGDNLTNVKNQGFYVNAAYGSFQLEKMSLISANDIPTAEPNVFDATTKEADLSRFIASNASNYTKQNDYYQFSTSNTTDAITLDITSTEGVKGTNLGVKMMFAEAASVKVTFKYDGDSDSQSESFSSVTTATIPLDANKALTQLVIQNTSTEAQIIKLSSVAIVDYSPYMGTELVTAEGSEVASTAFPFQFKAESSADAGDGTNWKKANFAANQFSSVKAGDKIYIYVAQAEGCNIALQEYGGGGALPNGNNITVADGKAVYELTASAAAFLKDNGASLTGQNYTVNKVTLVAGDGSASTVTMDVANFYDITGGKRLYFGSGSTQAISGNKELIVTFSEATTAKTTIEVTYVNDETAASSKSAESGVTTIAVPLTSNATIKKIEVKSTGTITMSNIAISDAENPTAISLIDRFSADESDAAVTYSGHVMTTTEDNKYIQAWISDDNISGKRLVISVAGDNPPIMDILVQYNGDGEKPIVYAGNTSISSRVLKLDETKTIQKVQIYLPTKGTATFSEIYIDNEDNNTAEVAMFKLTATAVNGQITVKKDGETGNTDNREFEYGTKLTLTATAAEGFQFSKWLKNGEAAGTEATLTVTMDADVTIEAVFKGPKLNNEEHRTLWKNSTGQALDWSLMFAQSEEVGEIVEAGEILIFSVSAIGDNPKIWLMSNDGNTTIAEHNALTVGENRMSITSDMVTKMAGGFKFKGGGATITKVELYKPTPITALKEEETKTLWSNTSGTALSWNTIAIERAAEWGAVLEEDERIIISVKAKEAGDDVWPTVQLQNDTEKIASTANLLNDLTVPCDITITLTAEMVNKMKNGFSITGDKATITKAVLYKPTMPTKTVHTLNSTETAISGDTNVTVAAEKFANISAYDVLTVNFTITTSPANVILKGNGEDGGWDYLKEMKFENGETLFALPLTPAMTSNLKKNGLQITGSGYTFKSVTIKTAGEVPSDEEKKDDEKKGDEEAIIDKKTGEADLAQLAAQNDTKTTLTQNEDGSITMTTTEAYQAAQIWFNDPEVVAGNVLKVQLAESSVNVTVTVKYTDGTQSQMSANTMAAKARGAVKAATRADSGTEIEVPLETGKEVQNIEVKNNVAGTITIQKMQVTTINVFTNGVANLSMLKPQSNATYDTSTHTLATTKGWTGATISPVDGEKVSGKELLIEFAEAAKVKVAVKYRTDVEGPSIIMEKAAANVRLALDNTKNIQEISIQPTDAAIVTFTKIAVNGEESDDGKLKPGKSITLWENSAGEKLAWNEVAKQGEDIAEMLQEYDELLITVSGVAEDCDWPKVFLRDANSEQAGNEVLLNDVASFPYTVRIVLTGDMAEQLANGFCVCGDGITVTKLVAYRPEEPKEGDIHLADLNYGYNSSYDKGTHTITTTSRWAARGWEIGDKRYNDKNLIIVKFEPVDFPVTLKMEYTTGVQTAQATSVGVPAGRTELMLEIPQGISKLNRVYLIYEEPGSLRLTEASVVYQDKLKLSTAIQAFEAEGVIRDGRYDTDGWYNLRGMRIQEPKTSGVYIHGGKKVVIY